MLGARGRTWCPLLSGCLYLSLSLAPASAQDEAKEVVEVAPVELSAEEVVVAEPSDAATPEADTSSAAVEEEAPPGSQVPSEPVPVADSGPLEPTPSPAAAGPEKEPSLPFSPVPRPPDYKPTIADEADEEHSKKPKRFGAMLDAGLPGGAMLSFVYRHQEWVRGYVGAGSNTISPGIGLGGTLIPFGVGPSLSLEYGHYFEGNANGMIGNFAGAGYEDLPLFERLGYDFANAHLGLDFGRERFTFFVHGGFTYLWTALHGIEETLGAQNLGTDTTIEVGQDPKVTTLIPSFKMGMVAYF